MTGEPTSLHEAIAAGDVQAVREALDAGEDIDAVSERSLIQDTGLSALHVALLAVDPNVRRVHLKTNTARRFTEGYRSVARLLIERGANIHGTTERGRAAIHLAARSGDAELTRMLIERGAAPTARTRGGDTPLHFAGTPEVALALIEAGAPVMAGGHMGMMYHTPLHCARSAAVAEVLLRHGARVNDTGGMNGMTPLAAAVLGRRIDVARCLVEAGASLTLPDTHGRSPLHHAAAYPDPEVVTYLLEHGADPDHRDRDGQTPLELARAAGYEENVRRLEARWGPRGTGG